MGECQNAPATVMDVMRATNDNLQRVLNKKEYRFQEQIEAIRTAKKETEISYEEVAALPCSPALRRGIWTAVRIVRELVAHLQTHGGYQLRSIYIENTREELPKSQKKRTDPRLRQIEQAYEDLKNQKDLPQECRNVLERCKKENKLDDRQYLYLMQLGKCMYSGKPLDFDHLEATTQIDHILPRCYIPDDSLENRVLVLSGENQRKADDKLLDESICRHQEEWWRHLRRQGLIGDKKLKNLLRRKVTDDEKCGFIARQLVETSQIVQHVTALFKSHYPQVHVRGIKAGLSSELRAQYELYKIRELNDLHHAYDAFLAATMGNFVERFVPYLDDEPSASVRREKLKKLYGDRFDGNAKHGMILTAFQRDQLEEETGEILRNAQKDIDYLKEVWGYHDGHVVYLKREKSGEFWEASCYRAGSASAKRPLKQGLSCVHYGGFDGIQPAFMAAIQFRQKKKRYRKVVGIPLYANIHGQQQAAQVQTYVAQRIPEAEVIRPRILINQLMEWEGNRFLLRGGQTMDAFSDSGSQVRMTIGNGKQLFVSGKDMTTIARLLRDKEKPPKVEDLRQLVLHLLDKFRIQYPCYYEKCADRDIRDIQKRLEEPENMTMDEWKSLVADLLDVMGKQVAKRTWIKCSDLRVRMIPDQNVTLIDQSITGLYEKRTKLWQDSEQL